MIACTAAYVLSPFVDLVGFGLASRCSAQEMWRVVTRAHRPDPAAEMERACTVAARDEKARLVLLNTPSGDFWVPEGSEKPMTVFLAQQRAKVYGTDGFAPRRGEIVLDCGAHVGAYTRQALNLGAAVVVAIEPAPENIECLARNFAEEIKAGRVIVCPKGVWKGEAVLALFAYAHNSGAASFVGPGREEFATVKAAVTSIDRLVSELGLKRVDFIKMSVNGAAPEALEGARGTLTAYHPRLAVSVERRLDSPKRVEKRIRRAWGGYRSRCAPCEVFREPFMPRVMFYY